MSWQNFVDESLLGTSQVARASIHGLDGKRYASSAGFVVGLLSVFVCKHFCVLTFCERVLSRFVVIGTFPFLFS